MSENNDSANYTSDSAQKEHKEEGNPRFGRGRRGTQEENGQNRDQSGDRKNDNSKGQNKDSNKSDSGSEKNHQNNQENSETPPKNPAQSEDQNQGQTPQPDKNGGQNNESEESKDNESEEGRRGGKDNEDDGRGRDTQSDDGRGRDDRSWRDDRSDGRSERGEFDELEEEECERPEPEEGEEECEPHNPELDEQGNPIQPGGPHHDFSDDGGEHGPRPNHHLPPPNEAPSYRPGFMERTSAYTLTFSSETMFEVLLGSLLILVSAVFLFIYMVKRQRRKTMRSQSPVQFVTPNQNIATANFYQYYQKEGLIPTGTVVGYIPEGQFLQPGAKNVENLKGFGRLQTQDEILDLS